MKRPAVILGLTALSACGGGAAPQAEGNEALRVNNQIQQQGQDIARQAENGTAAIEQALENEQGEVFENRAGLLNESGEPPARQR